MNQGPRRSVVKFRRETVRSAYRRCEVSSATKLLTDLRFNGKWAAISAESCWFPPNRPVTKSLPSSQCDSVSGGGVAMPSVVDRKAWILAGGGRARLAVAFVDRNCASFPVDKTICCSLPAVGFPIVPPVMTPHGLHRPGRPPCANTIKKDVGPVTRLRSNAGATEVS
ncbi:hypothetical protein AAG570_003444 [Ranatra chinensis]|uniref:Uncharacterized protein n=1 Tax=Ranatra chinensis TaxID=642074 RepID=A0ABD0YLR5_9HEMI